VSSESTDFSSGKILRYNSCVFRKIAGEMAKLENELEKNT